MASLNACDAVILCGGQGTRLRAALPDLPKVLAPIGGRPFLAYQLDQLRAAGMQRVLLALGFKAELVQQYLAEQNEVMEIVSSVESKPLGTGGALRALLPQLRARQVLVLNGDSFADVDLCALRAFHDEHRAKISMALTPVEHADRYGSVALDAEGRITAFREKAAGLGAGLINAGIYLMERDVIETIPAERAVSLEREVFPLWRDHGLYGQRSDVSFLDIGTPESYAQAEQFFSRLRAFTGSQR